MKTYLCVSLLLLLLVAPLAAADKTGGKSLDDQLLDDLDSELLPTEKKTAVVKPPADDAKPRAPKDDKEGLNQKLLDEIDGEDIGLGPEPDPLTRISQTMRKVETRIEKRDTSSATQAMQKRILTDLDQLLEQTKKQCQGGQCKARSSSASKPSNGKPAGSQPAEGEPSSKPARDSTDRLAKAGKTDVRGDENLDQLVKQVWGHLPEKVRGQMQNVSAENFLPKYEKLIEEYYKRLAEEQSR